MANGRLWEGERRQGGWGARLKRILVGGAVVPSRIVVSRKRKLHQPHRRGSWNQEPAEEHDQGDETAAAAAAARGSLPSLLWHRVANLLDLHDMLLLLLPGGHDLDLIRGELDVGSGHGWSVSFAITTRSWV